MDTFSCILTETWPLSGTSAVIACDHRAHVPSYNASACERQKVEWVAHNYPRYASTCQSCKQEVIIYASLDHAIAGGWY